LFIKKIFKKIEFFYKIIYSDDFPDVFKKPSNSQLRTEERIEAPKKAVKFFEEIKSPLETLLEETKKPLDKKNEDWNDFEHFEEFPNQDKKNHAGKN
jgi:hypothetical protein